MKAVRVHTFGGPEVLKVESDVPIPVHTESQVYIFFYLFFPFFFKGLCDCYNYFFYWVYIGVDSGWFSWCKSS